MGGGMGFAKGTLIMEQGEYYYTILFEPLQCCVFGSVCSIDIEKDEDVNWFDFWRLWPDYPDPHENFPGSVIKAGFYVNMNKKLLIVYDHNKKKEIKRLNFKEEWKKIFLVFILSIEYISLLVLMLLLLSQISLVFNL